MAEKFRGVEIVREIDEALDKGLRRFVLKTQAQLSQATPVDTGRLASSWFVGLGVADRSVAPERDAPGEVTVTKPSFQITMDNDYWISNSLPYANRVATDPVYAKGGRVGAADWFTRIENRLDKSAQQSFDFYLRRVK